MANEKMEELIGKMKGSFFSDVWDGITGESAKDAAKAISKSVDEAGQISKGAAIDARHRVTEAYGDAYREFSAGIDQAKGEILKGSVDSGVILQNTEAAAGRLIEAGGREAKLDLSTGFGRARADLTTAERGVEEDIRQGFGDAETSLRQTATGAREDVRQGFAGAERAITEAAPERLGAIASGFEQARGDVTEADQAAINQLQQQFGIAREALDPTQELDFLGAGIDRALSETDEFKQFGVGAAQLEAALSGALGPEAQAEAFAQRQESPGQKFLREQAQRGLLAGASATGGLGGGKVLQELQKQAIGLADQNLQQDIANLRSIGGRGVDVAGQRSGIGAQAALAGTGIIGDVRRDLVGLETGLGSQVSAIESATGRSLGELAAQSGLSEEAILSNVSSLVADVRAQTGMSEAEILQGLGTNLSGVQTGEALALGETGARFGSERSGLSRALGEQTANMDLGLLGAQTDITTQFGADRARLADAMGINLSNLSASEAANLSNMLIGEGTALGNISLGQGNNAMNLALQGGQAKAAGIQGRGAGLTNLFNQAIGIGTFAAGGGFGGGSLFGGPGGFTGGV